MLRVQENLPRINPAPNLPAPQIQRITVLQNNVCGAIWVAIVRMAMAIQNLFISIFCCRVPKPPATPVINNPVIPDNNHNPQPPVPPIPPRQPIALPPVPPIHPRPPRPPIDLHPAHPGNPNPGPNPIQAPPGAPLRRNENIEDERYNILVFPDPQPFQRNLNQREFAELDAFPNIKATFERDHRSFHPLRALTHEELVEYEQLCVNGNEADPALFRRLNALNAEMERKIGRDEDVTAEIEQIGQVNQQIEQQANERAARIRYFERRVKRPGEISLETENVARGFAHDLRGLKQRPPIQVANDLGDVENIDIDRMMEIFDATYPNNQAPRMRANIKTYVDFIKDPIRYADQNNDVQRVNEHYIRTIQTNCRTLISALSNPDVLMAMKQSIFMMMSEVIEYNYCNPRRSEELQTLANYLNEGNGPVFRNWVREEGILFHSMIRWKAAIENDILQNAFDNFHFINHVRNSPVGENWGLEYAPGEDVAAYWNPRPLEVYTEILEDQFTPAKEIREITGLLDSRCELAEKALAQRVRKLYPNISEDFLYLLTTDQPEIFYKTKIVENRPIRVPNDQFTAFLLESYGFITRQGQARPPAPLPLLPIQIRQGFIDRLQNLTRAEAINGLEGRTQLTRTIQNMTERLREPQWNGHFRLWFQRILDIANLKLARVNERIAALPEEGAEVEEIENDDDDVPFVAPPPPPAPVAQGPLQLTDEQRAEIDQMFKEQATAEIAEHEEVIANHRARAANPIVPMPRRVAAQRMVDQADARLAYLRAREAIAPRRPRPADPEQPRPDPEQPQE